MALHIYNTMSQKKEEFKPLKPNHVGMYVCGPTVYNFLHVGNFRGPIFFNFVRNYFEHKGYEVKYVYNYTDVDDKIIKAAAEQKISSTELSEKYIVEFEKDFKNVGLTPATVNPRVTTHIKEIISIIEDIIKSGAGYVVDGEVFCSVPKIKDYGKLSHKNLEDLIAGIRVEIGEKKKNPADFSLWKPAKPGEPFWESPWGNGRPGWHIECSAMAKKHLGESFDIHGGGIDLIFPHHENEIAQSESATGKKMVNYWMHNNFINMGKEKMSKSLGNIFTARNFLEIYNGEILKFLILSSHYRSASEFSDTVIQHSIGGLARIYSSLAQAAKWRERCVNAGFKADDFKDLEIKALTGIAEIPKNGLPVLDEKGFGQCANSAWVEFHKAAEDDFNTPEMMAVIFNLVRSFNNLLRPGLKPSQELANTCVVFNQKIVGMGKLLALFQKQPAEFLNCLDDMLLRNKKLDRLVIQSKVDERFSARQSKDFKKSDEIRNELVALGVEIRDNVDGTEWEVKK